MNNKLLAPVKLSYTWLACVPLPPCAMSLLSMMTEVKMLT